MEGFVNRAKQYLESEEGQEFEQSLKDQFFGGKESNDSSSSSSSGQRSRNTGQDQDSTAGMNSAPSDRLDTASNNTADYSNQYSQAGQENSYNQGAYNAVDTTSSGGYGTNEAGDSFSQANQSGMGGNSGGQFGGLTRTLGSNSSHDPEEASADQGRSGKGSGDDQGY